MLEHMRSDSNTRYKRGRAAAVEGHGFMTLGVAMTRLKRGLIPMLQSGTPMRGGSQPRRPYANTIISPMPIRVLTPAIATPRQSAAVRLSDWNLICFLRTALSRRDCPNLQESRGNPAIVPAAIHKKRFNESRQPRRPFTLRLIERDPDPFLLAPDNAAGKARSTGILAQTPQGAESERAGGFGRASLLRCHQRRCTCPFQPPPRRAGLANYLDALVLAPTPSKKRPQRGGTGAEV
jgi:hypothetical protein